MGGWYRVVKTIKGHQYLYEQQTFPEGGQVRTRNRCVGKAGSGDTVSSQTGSQKGTGVTTTPLFTDPADFARAMATQFDAAQWGRYAGAQLTGQRSKRTRRSKTRKPVTTHTKSKNRTSKQFRQRRATGDDFRKKLFLGYDNGNKVV